MVPSGKVARYSSRKKCSHTPNLAHGNDLMFDHTMRAALLCVKQLYGDYCDL
jgi:hypothetical protein